MDNLRNFGTNYNFIYNYHFMKTGNHEKPSCAIIYTLLLTYKTASKFTRNKVMMEILALRYQICACRVLGDMVQWRIVHEGLLQQVPASPDHPSYVSTVNHCRSSDTHVINLYPSCKTGLELMTSYKKMFRGSSWRNIVNTIRTKCKFNVSFPLYGIKWNITVD